jgi:hypothetical protein
MLPSEQVLDAVPVGAGHAGVVDREAVLEEVLEVGVGGGLRLLLEDLRGGRLRGDELADRVVLHC